MNEIIIYSLPVFGVIIGAFMQYIITRKNEAKKQQNLLKVNAYTDFIKGIAGIGITQNYNDLEKEEEYKILLTDAKGRICIYGTDKVIKKISKLWIIGANLDNPESNKAFVEIIAEMRKDNMKMIDITLNDISQLTLSQNVE